MNCYCQKFKMAPVSKQFILISAVSGQNIRVLFFSGHPILIKDPCSISQNRIDVILRITKPCLGSFDVLSYNTLRSGFRSGVFFKLRKTTFENEAIYVLWTGESSIYQYYLACRYDFLHNEGLFLHGVLHVWCNQSRQKI